MERRTFLGVIAGGLLAAPLAAEGQPVGKVARVGWLSPFSEPRATFREAMRELGYVEGRTLAFEIRLAEGRYDRLSELAAELVRSKVDIIVAIAPSAARAAQQATREIPIVFWWGGPDLVESGMVASFARPGGNLTGIHLLLIALDPKRLELLVEAVPAVKKVAVLTHGGPRFDSQQLPGVRKMAQSLGVKLHLFDVDPAAGGYESAFQSMGRVGVDALLVPGAPTFLQDRKSIIALAARQRIPAIYEWGVQAAEGGLMAYGPSFSELDRQTANYVDKILKGARPGDLPVQQPTKFELVINLKTAKALGLTIPPSLLQRADQVIE